MSDAKESGGLKFDTGKVPWELLPWDAVEQVVKVLQFGAKKYAPRNWEKGISYSRIFGAIERHAVAWFQRREDKDPETGLHPLAHLGCECLFALAFALRGVPNLDDRPVTEPKKVRKPSPWVDCDGKRLEVGDTIKGLYYKGNAKILAKEHGLFKVLITTPGQTDATGRTGYWSPGQSVRKVSPGAK